MNSPPNALIPYKQTSYSTAPALVWGAGTGANSTSATNSAVTFGQGGGYGQSPNLFTGGSSTLPATAGAPFLSGSSSPPGGTAATAAAASHGYILAGGSTQLKQMIWPSTRGTPFKTPDMVAQVRGVQKIHRAKWSNGRYVLPSSAHRLAMVQLPKHLDLYL